VVEGDRATLGSALALSAPERRLLAELQRLPTEWVEEEEVAERVGVPIEVARSALQWLRAKHLAVVDETTATARRLTKRGEEALRSGLPERRLLEAIAAHPKRALGPEEVALAGLSGEERSAAIGILRRRGLLAEGVPFRRATEGPVADFPEERALRDIADAAPEVDATALDALQKRGLATLERSTTKRWRPSEEGARLTLAGADEGALGAVTPALLAGELPPDALFRPYDVRAPVPHLTGARPHPYLAWLREFEEILIGLGFQQSEGPLLETEFWNSDVLFMPQEHPARSIHDVLTVRNVRGKAPSEELFGRVIAAHEGRALAEAEAPLGLGWRYPYDRAMAARPVLRSQTTAVSGRFLASHPKPPFRMYCIDRNFRREAVDATHHVEFGQCEGVLGDEGVTLRHLIGVFTSLAEAIGIREVKFRPSYFPFTEPSIEGYVRHPRLGWIEVFPGGLFRPEVLRPLGIQVPVAAWGIGVTRLAMIGLGIADIRDLFLDDLTRLTGREA
jgi:phenylalanyl-tRNA synthetase alpha chain